MKIAIVGHGFVGKAVDFAFNNNFVEKYIVDPKYGTSLEKLPKDIDYAFICAPTPMGSAGNADFSIVKQAIDFFLFQMGYDIKIVIKSTVTPGFLSPYRNILDVIHNPEFLTESNPLQQFVNPEFMIFGGDPDRIDDLYDLYYNCSRVIFPDTSKVIRTSLTEAAYAKYAINNFLAMKVIFFNQLFDAIGDNITENYNSVARAVAADPRIGPSHINVPGFDGKHGFGGACFPKDIAAFVSEFPELSLLRKVQEINNDYRSGYELSEREKDNAVSYTDLKHIGS